MASEWDAQWSGRAGRSGDGGSGCLSPQPVSTLLTVSWLSPPLLHVPLTIVPLAHLTDQVTPRELYKTVRYSNEL